MCSNQVRAQRPRRVPVLTLVAAGVIASETVCPISRCFEREVESAARSQRYVVMSHRVPPRLCYQKMSSARMSRGETLVLVMQPAQDRPTHDLALAPGR